MSMNTLYMVLGMHRSGTSLTVQLLKKMNVWVGNEEQMLLKDQYNERGYWELADLVQIDDLLLAKSKLMWYSLKNPDLDEELALQLISDLVQKYFHNNKEKIAIKDPRLSVIWRQWIKSMKCNDRAIKGVIVVRNPLEVADSLYKRDCMQREYALCLWYQYNWQCLLFSKEYEAIWLDYSEYFSDFVNLSDRLWKFVYGNENKEKNELNDTVDEQIRHFKQDMDKVQNVWLVEKVMKLYVLLQKLSKGQIEVEEIVDNCLNEYQEVVEYGLKMCDKQTEEAVAKETYFQIIGKNPQKYWTGLMTRWLKVHKQPIILCGNGNNLEKLLPVLETVDVNVVGIYDRDNFSERFYKGAVMEIWSWDQLMKETERERIYLITPFYENEEEMYNQISNVIKYSQIYKLSDILLGNAPQKKGNVLNDREVNSGKYYDKSSFKK